MDATAPTTNTSLTKRAEAAVKFDKEEVRPLLLGLANRFGRWYAQGSDKSVSARVVVEGKAGHQRRVSERQP